MSVDSDYLFCKNMKISMRIFMKNKRTCDYIAEAIQNEILSGRMKAGDARGFDTLKSKKVPQSLEIGLFFCQIFIFII